MKFFKKTITILLLTCLCTPILAQKNKTTIPQKKYNSLLWEITGKGIKKRSFLFGTMHVSSKLAFNLSDTFYNAIKSVDAVAIENNPLYWQQEYNESIFTKMGSLYSIANNQGANDYITKSTFQFNELEAELKAALAMDPEIVNHFLYRSYNSSADFEEDTYLDMHIFQCGKRLGKKVFGLENFRETENLIIKGMRAEAGESKLKSKSTEAEDDNKNNTKSTNEKIQDAYRNGDLDMLDSLNKKEFRSEVFNDYFLYARNQIHADGIANTINDGNSIFAAVGAAHLPGKKGVIEMLRAKGYTLKPIAMGLQLSKQREELNKITLPTNFTKQYADDSMFSVATPGKLYNFNYASNGQKQWLNADFTNGAYYMITRVSTNGLLWGKNEEALYKKIDSLLYENIPGKILERATITNNGYKGFNIVNKTRKGDVQRYNIFITPLELIVFKMSGFEDYVKGNEANSFFSSIQLQSIQTNWQTFSPKTGGFSINLPHKPIDNNGNGSLTNNYYAMYMGKNEGKGYEAYDKKSDTYIAILEKNIANYDFLEEDTFSLALANESLLTTTLFKLATERKVLNLNNFNAIETSGKCTDEYNYTNRIINVGSKYYTIITKYKNQSSVAKEVLNSFNFKPQNISKTYFYYDSLLKFTVTSTLAPDSLKAEFMNITRLSRKTQEQDEKTSKTEIPYWKNQDKIVFKNDSTSEEVIVLSGEYPKYYSIKDSAEFWKTVFESVNTKIGKNKSEYFDFASKVVAHKTEGDKQTYEVIYTDTNCNQNITAKFILNKARLYTIYTTNSNYTNLSESKKSFFETFTPVFDSTTNYSLNIPKAKVFFKDYFSKDSATAKWARKNIEEVRFVEADLPEIITALSKLEPTSKNYFKDKSALIKEISNLKKDTNIALLLNNFYTKAADTATFQNACILALSNHKSKSAFNYLANLIANDPPVFDNNDDVASMFWNFKDTLQLTKIILPQVATLVNLEDYKWQVYNTLARGLDSGFFEAKDYESIYNKIYFDARIELKKLLASDEKKINKPKAEEDASTIAVDDEEKTSNYNSTVEDLNVYAKLLIPFWDNNQNIPIFFDKLLASRNNEAKLNTAKVLYRNKKKVNDSIWTTIAKEEKQRLALLDFLQKNKIEHLIPANIAKQNIFCKAILQSDYNKKDSLVYLNTFLPTTIKNKTGNVHFFKFKNNEKEVDWKIALCGLQPADLNKVNDDETIVEFTDKVLKTNKTIQEQLSKILKEQLYALRKSSSKFYDGNRYDYNNLFGGR
jgi:uncharacterized protein YbaP (TraB family)